MIALTLKRGGQYKFQWHQGDEFPLELTLRDSIGDPIDLTNMDVNLTLKLSLFDSAATHTLVGTVGVGAAEGIVTFDVTNTETANVRLFVAEIEVTDGVAYTETLYLLQVNVGPATV